MRPIKRITAWTIVILIVALASVVGCNANQDNQQPAKAAQSSQATTIPQATPREVADEVKTAAEFQKELVANIIAQSSRISQDPAFPQEMGWWWQDRNSRPEKRTVLQRGIRIVEALRNYETTYRKWLPWLKDLVTTLEADTTIVASARGIDNEGTLLLEEAPKPGLANARPELYLAFFSESEWTPGWFARTIFAGEERVLIRVILLPSLEGLQDRVVLSAVAREAWHAQRLLDGHLPNEKVEEDEADKRQFEFINAPTNGALETAMLEVVKDMKSAGRQLPTDTQLIELYKLAGGSTNGFTSVYLLQFLAKLAATRAAQ